MSKEQTFRSEDKPFGIANGISQIPKYGICNLRSVIPSASEDRLLQVCPSLTFNCGIRVEFCGSQIAELPEIFQG
jgi:hypothetical protein